MFLARKFQAISQTGFNLVYLLLLVGLVALGFVVFQITQNQPPKPTQPTTLTKVKYVLGKGAPHEIRALITKKYGIDKKHGLDIEFTYLNPGDVERVLFSGEFQVGAPSTLSVVTANLKGIPLRIFGPEAHMTHQVVAPIDSPIKSLADLKGKKFGILPKSSAAYTATAVVLKSAGIDVEKDLQLVFGDLPHMVEFLKSGEVDAAIVLYPQAAKLFETGKYKSIAKLEDVWRQNENGLPLPHVIAAANENWLVNNKETARRLNEVSIDASNFIQKNPSVIATLTEYRKTNGFESDVAEKLVEENTPKLMYEKWDDQDINGLKTFLQKAKELNIIPPDSPATDKILVYPL